MPHDPILRLRRAVRKPPRQLPQSRGTPDPDHLPAALALRLQPAMESVLEQGCSGRAQLEGTRLLLACRGYEARHG